MNKVLNKILPLSLSVALIVTASFLVMPKAQAAISEGTINSAVNANFTGTVDVGANALAVLVGTHQGTITGVTYGGVSMTQVGSGCSAFNECGYIFLLLAPTVGTSTVAISRSGGSSHAAASISLSGVKQTTTVTNTSLSSGGCNGCSLAITPSSDSNLILSAIGAEASVNTVSDTVIANSCNQSFECFGSQYFQQTTAAAKTMTFNLSSGQRAGMADVALEPLASSTSSSHAQVNILGGRTVILNERFTIP